MDTFTNLGCRYSNWWHHELNITTTYSTISDTWPDKITWWRAFLHKLYTISTSICKQHPNFRSTFIALATLVRYMYFIAKPNEFQIHQTLLEISPIEACDHMWVRTQTESPWSAPLSLDSLLLIFTSLVLRARVVVYVANLFWSPNNNSYLSSFTLTSFPVKVFEDDGEKKKTSLQKWKPN